MAPRKLRCPWCGSVIWTDQATLRIAHQEPECASFAQAVRQMGGSDGQRLLLDESSGEETQKVKA